MVTRQYLSGKMGKTIKIFQKLNWVPAQTPNRCLPNASQPV